MEGITVWKPLQFSAWTGRADADHLCICNHLLYATAHTEKFATKVAKRTSCMFRIASLYTYLLYSIRNYSWLTICLRVWFLLQRSIRNTYRLVGCKPSQYISRDHRLIMVRAQSFVCVHSFRNRQASNTSLAVHVSSDEGQIYVQSLHPETVISFALWHHSTTRCAEGKNCLNIKKQAPPTGPGAGSCWSDVWPGNMFLYVQTEVDNRGEVVIVGSVHKRVTIVRPKVVTQSPHQHHRREKQRNRVGLHHQCWHLAIAVEPLPHTLAHLDSTSNSNAEVKTEAAWTLTNASNAFQALTCEAHPWPNLLT